MAKITVSVLAMDRLETTRKCIDSIFRNSQLSDYDLILTDNGSKDGTAEYFAQLGKDHAFCTAILNPDNQLFIGPHCRAFEMAKARGSKYFVTANDDIIVPTGWLEELAKPLDNLPKAAISGPRAQFSELNKTMLGASNRKLEYIEGSCLCVKIELAAKQGPLFSSYLDGIYGDDADLALRMQRAGYTIHWVPFVLQHNRNYAARAPEARKRCIACNAKNQATMMKRWQHWNMVRRFDFQIVVKRRFAMGDVLLTTPIIRALKQLWPLCPIDVETDAPDILKGNPNVRRASNRIGLQPGALVIDLNGAYEKTPSIPVLASYARVAGTATGLEYAMVKPHLDLYWKPTDAKPLGEGRWVALHVGPTTWPGKNWPMDRWIQVADRLRKNGYKVMLLGAKEGRDPIPFDLDLRKQKGVQELAAFLFQCCLFVGLDSFPAHVAAAVQTPSIVLFGVMDPRVFAVHSGPFEAVCSSPTHPDTGRRNRTAGITFLQTTDACMRTISVDQVLAAIDRITKIPAL